MQQIQLQDYTIYIGGHASPLRAFLAAKSYSKYFVIVDENTKEYCLPILQQTLTSISFEVIEIKAGEQHKNIDTCQLIWKSLMDKKADRKSLCMNLGGGVIGDMGGFCASTFKRGMDFIQIPTTLLSQVDASIGGKLGIDFMQVKNSIGLFKNPKAVFIDPQFLNTLSLREVRSGFAEVIKHSLIANQEQWTSIQLIKDLEHVDWLAYLKPSLQIKQQIVEQDPFEKGLRKALNFGHTIGHAIEGWALETDTPLLHGEAIAIGMICESYLAHQNLGLTQQELDQIVQFILNLYGHYPLDQTAFDSFLDLMKNDKKNEDDQINFSLIDPIGTAVINQTASRLQIQESLQFYNKLAHERVK